jgi:DNA polymerase I-like protein with 3'-5' exonuclease and polymerase domains
MKTLILDLETTIQRLNGKIDNSPFNPKNKCVSAHFCWLGEPVQTLVFHHNEKKWPDSPDTLKQALEEADILVAHNAKFDVQWLVEMGFSIPETVYCTMIGEYILAKGHLTEVIKDEEGKDKVVPKSLSLKRTAERRDVTRKKSDLVDELFKSGTGFEMMPLDTVMEYAEADVISCQEIYQAQQEDYAKPENTSMAYVVTLMNEMLLFLVELEKNGIKVDLEKLEEIKQQFTEEHQEISKRLEEIVEQVMGDTPINLASGEDMNKVIYSRRVKDKNKHKQVFNIGPKKFPPWMNKAEFARAVRATTELVQKTDAKVCPECNGAGRIRKFKVNGEPYKNTSPCKTCDSKGALYVPNGKTAGLKLVPREAEDASVHGFKTDKTTIQRLIDQAAAKGNDIAVEFLTKLSRMNALSTYLDSFIQGIETWTRPDGLLHTNFNQCITATGRLSSSNPNFQNQPKRGFPVRSAVISRFENGKILETDYSNLEFVMAGELSRDPQIIKDVLEGKDLHKQTASIIYQCEPEQVSKDQRQNSKKFSFSPIYGGVGGGEAPHIRNYFKEFFNIYKGLGAYHKKLTDGVMKDGHITTFSGRQFYWPDETRRRNGRTKHYTQQVNYPVQSTATADIVPLSCIRALRKFKELNLKSKLVLTVHDSIVVDTHPDELEQVKEALTWAMEGVTEEATDRWGYEFALPLKIEISGGKNWLDQVEFS